MIWIQNTDYNHWYSLYFHPHSLESFLFFVFISSFIVIIVFISLFIIIIVIHCVHILIQRNQLLFIVFISSFIVIIVIHCFSLFKPFLLKLYSYCLVHLSYLSIFLLSNPISIYLQETGKIISVNHQQIIYVYIIYSCVSTWINRSFIYILSFYMKK